jgi:alpha-L-rhamnosidase
MVFISCNNNVDIVDMRCEYLDNPIQIDITNPRFQWRYSANKGFCQQSYVLEVATGVNLLKKGKADVWSSGVIESGDCHTEMYDNVPLMSMTDFYWRVTARDSNGRKVVSPVAHFETAKMEGDYWRSVWIADSSNLESNTISSNFRREFSVTKEVTHALLFMSGITSYKIYINGKTVGNSFLNFAFADNPKQVYYETYDITDRIVQGKNAIAVIMGNSLLDNGKGSRVSRNPKHQMLCGIIMENADGTREQVPCDEKWKFSNGYVTNDKDGDMVYDLHNDHNGWMLPYFDDSKWERVTEMDNPAPSIKSQLVPPMKEQIVKALDSTSTDSNTGIYDLGSEIIGTYSMSFKASKGASISVTLSNDYDGEGHLKSGMKDIFVADASDSLYTFHPYMNFRRYRYAEISSDKSISDVSFSGERIRLNLARTGFSCCSDSVLNDICRQADKNYVNLTTYSFPENHTGCDESNLFNSSIDADYGLMAYDAILLYENFVKDIINNQNPDGSIDNLFPGMLRQCLPAGILDAVAAFHIPCSIYTFYGDSRCMSDVLRTCRRYLAYMEKNMEHDFLVDGNLLENCVYYYDYSCICKMSEVLGKDYSFFESRMKNIRNAINAKWFDAEKGGYENSSLYGVAAAWLLGLVPERHRKQVGKHIAENANMDRTALEMRMSSKQKRLGRFMVLNSLAMQGLNEEALEYVHGPDAPEASVIETWMCKYLGGIRPEEKNPGFSHFTIKPYFSPSLTYASGWHKTPYGNVRCFWKREENGIKMVVEIPANSSATVVTNDMEEMGSGVYTFTLKGQ